MTISFKSEVIVNSENKDGMVYPKEISYKITPADYAICNFGATIPRVGKPQNITYPTLIFKKGSLRSFFKSPKGHKIT